MDMTTALIAAIVLALTVEIVVGILTGADRLSGPIQQVAMQDRRFIIAGLSRQP